MSNPEQSEPPQRLYKSITGNATQSPTVTRTQTNGSGVRRKNTASSRIHKTNTNVSHKEPRDPGLDINLPYRTFSDGANLEEYVREEVGGEIEGPVEPDGQHHYKLVTFVPNDPANPKNWSKAYKWYCTMIVALTCFVVAFCSSVITAGIIGPEQEFQVSEEVSLVAISVFVVGFGIGMWCCDVVCSLADVLQVPWPSPPYQKYWADD
jgi:hypothetical protein